MNKSSGFGWDIDHFLYSSFTVLCFGFVTSGADPTGMCGTWLPTGANPQQSSSRMLSPVELRCKTQV